MPLPTRRRTAAPAFLLAAFLLAGGPTPAQDKNPPDAEAVLAKVKGGAGLTKVREQLAADPVGSRFRVDGFSLNKDKDLAVEGVMLVPGSNDEEKDKAAAQAREKVIAAVQEAAGAKEFKTFDFTGVKAVRGERLPHLQLQKAANEAGKRDRAADELKLADSKFDAKGRLVLVGQRGNNAKTTEWLTAAVPTALAENPAAVGPDGKTRAAVVLELAAPPQKTDWPMSPAAIQGVFAKSNNPTLTRLRVDRAYLVSSPVKADGDNPGGASWQYVVTGIALGQTRPDPQAIQQAVQAAWRPAVEAGFWAAVKEGDVGGLTDADNRAPDPGPHFQKAVAARPALDGVRIDERTEFGPEGRLVLTGLQPGLDARQLEELEQAVRGVIATLSAGSDANPNYRKLAEQGVSAAKLERVKVRELHADLRKWVGENLDDVRLARLYFDDKGQLTLTCEAPDESVKAAVERELVARAARVVPGMKAGELPAPKEAPKDDKKEPKDEKKDGGAALSPGRVGTLPVAARLADEPAKTDPAAPPRVAFQKFRGGLTRYLQQQVADPKNADWYALLIERGYFNERDEYTVRGVANSEEQKKAFAAYLASLKNDTEWAAYFAPKPPAAPELEVIPMAKLEERARRVMPAYPVFDGVRVVKARYEFVNETKNPGQRLVFDAHVVGRPDTTAAAKLTELIAADEKYYGRRLPKDRLVVIRAVAPDATAAAIPDDQIGDFSQGFGALGLVKGDMDKARDWVGRGLLHTPHVSSVWFLSAYYHHLQGDRELARRDLFRVIALEDPLTFDGPAQRKRRYAAAKDLQGERRTELEKVWLECWKEYKDGVRPPTFAEPQK